RWGVTKGSKDQAGANGPLDLHTRGDLKVKGKVKQEAQDQDPLSRQALAERRSKNATPAAGPTPAGDKAPPAGPVLRVSYPDARNAPGPAGQPPPPPIAHTPPPPTPD